MRKFIKYKENYIVCSDGVIYRIYKNKLKEQKQAYDKDGYRTVTINNTKQQAHRVVKSAFDGQSSMQVDHVDGNKENNKLENLEYVTSKENNVRRQKRLGNYQRESGKKVKYNNMMFDNQKDLAEYLNISQSVVSIAIKMNKLVFGRRIEVIK